MDNEANDQDQTAPLEVGDIVQLDPDNTHLDKCFAGCLFILDEVKPTRLRGYASVPKETGVLPGAAYVYLNPEDVTYVGRAEWVIP